MITNRPAAQHTLGISIGATNLAATSGAHAVVHPAVLRTGHGGWLSGFVDRIGDPVPLVDSDGSTHRAEALLGDALAAVTDALPGTTPTSAVAVAVPAHWHPSTVDALRASLPGRPRLVPDATAALWTLRASPGLPSRGVLVVCDVGGSGTSITLVDAAARDGRIGDTVRYVDFSGDLIDQAILGKAVTELGDAGRTDPSGTAMVGSLTRLREACRMAKHRLSAETATGITVDLPGLRTSIRLTRQELEGLLAAPLAGLLATLDDTLERNGVAPDQVSAVVTIGGGARIPLLTQRLSQHLRTEVVTAPHPHLCAAAGAALLAGGSAVEETATTLTPTAPAAAAIAPALAWSQDDWSPEADLAAVGPAHPVEFSRPAVEFAEPDRADAPPRRRGPLVALGLSAAAVAAALAVFGMSQFTGEPAPVSAPSSVAVSTALESTGLAGPAPEAVSPVAQTAVVAAPAPRSVPAGAPRLQRPAPVTTTVTAAPTTSATPVTTTPPTTTTTTSTTPTTTTSPTSTTTSTSKPEMTISHPIIVNPAP